MVQLLGGLKLETEKTLNQRGALPAVRECECRNRLVESQGNPRGSIYTTIMESGPQNHNGDGLLGPNSIIVVYMDPLLRIPCSDPRVSGPDSLLTVDPNTYRFKG